MATRPAARAGRALATGPVSALCAAGLLLAGNPAAGDAQIRPMVVVFPVGANVGSDVEVKKDASDGLTSDQRTIAAARAVRDCLTDSGAVAAVLYNPDSALFVRAEGEANLHLAHPNNPTESEREAIGKALEAVYVVAVSARPAVDAPSVLELVLQGNDVGSRKGFLDRTRMTSSLTAPAGASDSNSIRRLTGNIQFDNVVMSAANTVAIHLLKGPLGDYYRPAAPPEMQPHPLIPTLATTSSLPAAAPEPPPPTAGLHTSAATPVTAAPAVATSPIGAPLPAPTAAPAKLAQPAATAPARPDDTLAVSDAAITHTIVAGPKPIGVLPEGTAPAAAKPEKPETASSPGLNGMDAMHQALTLGANPGNASKAAKQQAQELLIAGDSSAAIMMLRKAINQDPLSASLRVQLAQTYLIEHRAVEAANEAQRAATLVSDLTAAEGASLATVLAQAFAETGDTTGARAVYTEVLSHDSHSAWAKVAIADLDAAEGKAAEAESAYRAVLAIDFKNRDAAIGLARLMALRGDYEGAAKMLSQTGGADSSPGSTMAHYEATTALFDEGMTRIATLMTQNRKAWDAASLSREVIFNATTAQTGRITGLVVILKAVPPPPNSSERVMKSYRRRIYAASLLSQASNELLNFLQTSDADSGAQSALELVECQKELAEAQRK